MGGKSTKIFPPDGSSSNRVTCGEWRQNSQEDDTINGVENKREMRATARRNGSPSSRRAQAEPLSQARGPLPLCNMTSWLLDAGEAADKTSRGLRILTTTLFSPPLDSLYLQTCAGYHSLTPPITDLPSGPLPNPSAPAVIRQDLAAEFHSPGFT